MSLIGKKSLWSSNTVRTCLVGIAAMLSLAGYNYFTAADVDQVVATYTAATQPDNIAKAVEKDQVIDTVGNIFAMILFVLGIYFRKNASQKIAMIVGLCILLPGTMGCQGPTPAEHAALREGMYAGMSTTFKEHSEWAGYIAGDTDNDGIIDGDPRPDMIPNLARFDVAQRSLWLEARRAPYGQVKLLVEEDRARGNR